MNGEDQEITDAILVQAMRKRLLEEISSGRSPVEAARIVNNIYGGSPSGQNGVVEAMAAQGGLPGSEDPFDYFVDINREDVIDPQTGEKKGWSKKVHRYRAPKKKDRRQMTET